MSLGDDDFRERKSSMQAALLASQRSRQRRFTESQSIDGESTETASPALLLPAAPAPPIRDGERKSSFGPNASPVDPTKEDNVASLVIALLDSSSQGLRKVIGQSLKGVLLVEEQSAASAADDGVGSVQPKATRSDMDALIQLATSPNLSMRKAACELLAENSESLPRGRQGIKPILQRTSRILELGTEAKNPHWIAFALQVGRAIALEGETWATRMVEEEHWGEKLGELLLTMDDPDLLLAALQVCSALSHSTSSEKYLLGCVKCVGSFPEHSDIVREACAVLCNNHPSIENEDVLLLFLETAANASTVGDFKLVADALRVVRAKSQAQAQMLTQLFEEAEIMNTLNALYRSQTFGSKLECALFIEALIRELGDDVASKVQLCESALIIRLIRLASPSSGTEEDGHDMAYLPAIKALTDLAQVERIGARIVLAGGLGPLFSHANSNSTTRAQAKKALQALGVSNLGSVVEAWIQATKMSATSEGEEPLEKINLYNGTKLLMPQPPPNFFTDIVNDPKAVLGRGAFSVVYRATLTSGKEVAVKRLTKAAAADPGFAEEIRVLARVPPHPNIVGLLGVFLSDTECLIISELGGPTLSSVLASERDSMDWKSRLNVLIGIADGMRHLHGLDPAILHLDLKASNVLLVGPDRVAKLCDFGLAVELKRGFEFLLPGEHGTIQYMAPECMRENDVELAKGFDAGADVYSFAMVLWEVAHPGRIPWQGEDLATSETEDITMAIRHAVLAGRRPTCSNMDKWPEGYYNIMERCWKKHAEDRPRFLANFFVDDDPNNKSVRSGQTIGTMLRKLLFENRLTAGGSTAKNAHLMGKQGSIRGKKLW